MFDEYDRKKIEKARKLIAEVHEYNYESGAETKKLETIIRKLDALTETRNKE